ncbi:recombination protein NinG [Rosenbergiella epipactidis]|uniref:recombination protein NinG n=1 Tax=Rosenbergiella epipactidis TaxID=1544694 RepID=UPI001F4E81BF|nr:recombination protein NinG [Rosenbergiella epipactidis]
MVKAKKPKPKTCRICKSKFSPSLSTQIVCSTSCAIQHGKAQSAKQAERKAIAERKAHREKKQLLKKLPEWNKEAQIAFNRFIRWRDYGKDCASCGRPLAWENKNLTGSSIDASHYRSRGAASQHRFNVFNVHAACTRCNRQLSGNAVEFRLRLIQRIGIEKVEAIESENTPRKFDIEYLKRIKAVFNRRARHYEKLRKRHSEVV